MKREVVGSYPISLVLIYSYLPSTLIYCVPSLVRCALTLVLPRSPCLPTLTLGGERRARLSIPIFARSAYF